MRIGDEAYTVQLEDGRLHVEAGAAQEADLDAAMSMETFYGLASSELAPRTALAEDRVQLLKGKPTILEHFFSLFSFAQRSQIAV